MRNAIRVSFGSTLKDFYYYGHAGPQSFDAGGITFAAKGQIINGRYRVVDTLDPQANLTVQYALDSRTPNSVYLDGCNTAVTTDWLVGWNISGQPESACLVRMGGLNGPITSENFLGIKSKSIWYDYDSRYWTNISLGQYMSQASSNAIRTCSGPVPGYSPKDSGLIQRYGDAQIPEF